MALVFAMAVPAFATENITEQKGGISNFSFEDGIQPRLVVPGNYTFNLYGTNLYLNVNNRSHPTTIMSGDTVIVWNDVGDFQDQ